MLLTSSEAVDLSVTSINLHYVPLQALNVGFCGIDSFAQFEACCAYAAIETLVDTSLQRINAVGLGSPQISF